MKTFVTIPSPSMSKGQSEIDDGKFFFLSGNVLSGRRLRSYNLTEQLSKDEASYSFSEYVNSSLVYHNNKVYVIGGEKGGNSTSDQVQIFDLSTKTWTVGPSMIEGRCEFSAVYMDGYIYAIGADQYDVYVEPEVPERKKRRKKNVIREWIGTNSVERLKIIPTLSKQWERLDYMNYSRHNLATGVINGRLYAVGGNAAQDGEAMKPSASVECYNPSEILIDDGKLIHGIWTTKSSMKTARIGHSVVVARGKIYAFGGGVEYKGMDESDSSKFNSLEIYDPHLDSWMDGPSMHKKRKYFGAFLHKDCIYAIGGDKKESNGATLEKLDLSTQKWTMLQDFDGDPLTIDDDYAHLWSTAYVSNY